MHHPRLSLQSVMVVIKCTAAVSVSVNLMGLLKWRDNPRGLETYLRLFMKVDGEEIVKVGEGRST